MSDGSTILLVDDELDLLENMSLTLATAGYRVVTATNGVEALATLQSEAVDLIVSDIEMPRMNGYQLYQHICEDPRWLSIPFLFLSCHTLESDIRYGKELGVDDYLAKPIRSGDLLAAVRGRLRRFRQLLQSEQEKGWQTRPQQEPDYSSDLDYRMSQIWLD